MFKLVLVGVFCLWALCDGAVAPQPRVVGGVPSDIARFPYQVSIQIEGNHHCGGSIISSQLILSAGHCVIPNIPLSLIRVLAGLTHLFQVNPRHVYGVLSFTANAQFDPVVYRNDIAYLVLDRKIQFEPKVAMPVLLGTQTPQPGSPLILTGWGATTTSGTNMAQTLQEIQLITYDAYKCAQAWQETPEVIHGNQVCTFNQYGEGSCKGDSGGPLVQTYNDGYFHQVGVVSIGRVCAIGFPDIFTDVSKFLPEINAWIARYP